MKPVPAEDGRNRLRVILIPTFSLVKEKGTHPNNPQKLNNPEPSTVFHSDEMPLQIGDFFSSQRTCSLRSTSRLDRPSCAI